MKKTNKEPEKTVKRAGEMPSKSAKHKFKTQSQELAHISLNLVEKIEHLVETENEKGPSDNTFTFDEIQKISTFEKNKLWSRGIESKKS